MALDEALRASLDDCFDAVVHPDAWPAALGRFAETMGARGAAFNSLTAPADRRRLTLPASPRYKDMLAEFVEDGWVSQDLRARRGWAMVQAGRKVVCEDDVTTAEERATSPIYRDLFARHELEMFAGTSMTIDGQYWNLNIVRSKDQGAFAGDEVRRLFLVHGAVRRLLMFAQQISAAEVRGALGALDSVDKAALVLDTRGCVQRVNACADALMGQGMDLRGGRLVAANPASHTALESLIAAATRGTMHDPIFIQRASGEALIVEAIPLKSARTDIFGQAGALLLITDTSATPKPSLDILGRAFGLTRRESAVAQALAEGEASRTIAEKMDLRESTVRQIVKTVLEKTDTRRQSELAAKLSRLPKAPRDH